MPYKDPEKQKEYREKNKEKQAEYMKDYYQNNKEKLAKQKAEYYNNNKEKRKAYDKKYQKEYIKTPNGKKSNTKRKWKSRGLKDSDNDNYEKVYNLYLNTNECNVCKYKFDKSNWRCLDHSHSTGLFRQILCHRCNNRDSWIKVKTKLLFKKVLENILEI